MKRLFGLVAAMVGLMACGAAQAEITDGVIKIGVMSDMSGAATSDLTGPKCSPSRFEIR